MSDSPSDLLGLRSRLAAETGLPAGDIGIAADPSHLLSGGYHCGGQDLKAIHAVANDDYSIRQPRDRAVYTSDAAAGRNNASAMDVGDDWPLGGRAGWIRFNNLLRAKLGSGDPLLAAVRGMNFTPDGTTKRRFDCLTHTESSSGDTVTWHTHIEWWRDTIALRATSIDRIVQIAVAARDNTGLAPLAPTNGDDMFLRTPSGSIYLAAGGKVIPVTLADWNAVSPQTYVSVPQSLVTALVNAPSGPSAAEIAAQVVAQLPPGALDEATVTAGALAALQSPEGQAALRKPINARFDDDATT